MLETNKINNERMKLADDLFLYKLDESLAWLFNIENGEHYKLNDSSHFILSLFDGKKTIGEIQKIYLNRYLKGGVGEPILLKDFNELLECMTQDNIFISVNK